MGVARLNAPPEYKYKWPAFGDRTHQSGLLAKNP